MQVIDSKAPATVTPNTAPVLCDAPAAQPKKLKQLVAEAIAVRHYSKRTFERVVVYHHGVDPENTPAGVIEVVLLAKGGAGRQLRIDRAGRVLTAEQAD